jgi:multidrug efflux system membrane fusion protein
MATSRSNLVARVSGLALVVAVAVLLFTCEPKEPDLPTEEVVRPAKTLRIETLDAVTSRRYPGIVRAAELVDLAFRVGGPLIEVPVRRGETVEAGQVIARIDPRDFETRVAGITSRLEEARAALKAMQAGARPEVLRQFEAQVAAAKADLGNAEVELGRMQKLFDEKVISQSDLDGASLRVDVASQKVAAAEEQLREARKGAREEDIEAQEARIRGLEAQRDEAANALADTTLTAPFDGVVARQHAENFQTVRPNEPIVSLQNVDAVEIVADVPESLIAFVRREDVRDMSVRFEAVGDREFPVTFREVEAEADRFTQTYAVSVTMAAPEDVRVLPGMAATLKISLDRDRVGRAGIPVPIEALFATPEGESRLWRVDPDTMRVAMIPVETGAVVADQVLITRGLDGGEEIVVAGVHFLREGLEVRRLEGDRP